MICDNETYDAVNAINRFSVKDFETSIARYKRILEKLKSATMDLEENLDILVGALDIKKDLVQQFPPVQQ